MKRYRDYNSYLREIFGERVQKISLDAGLDCPNRDGTISNKGCIFCDSRGSGSGAYIYDGITLDEQINRAKAFIKKRYGARKFIAYFQSFTNTYAPVKKLKTLYDSALAHEGMVGLSVGTRPDCIDDDILKLLFSYKDNYLVWAEYGLQSSHDLTLRRINRGHDVSSFKKAVEETEKYRINVCAHVILGLPGEDRDMMLQTARFLSDYPVKGVKIHLLYVLEGTPLAGLYNQSDFIRFKREDFVELVVDFLELLPPDMIIQRLTGDPPPNSKLLAPSWAGDKRGNLRRIKESLERRNTWQGRLFVRSTAGKN